MGLSKEIKWIFFDCMETLVDLTELPTLRDYAAWAYHGSEVEPLLGGFETFFDLYDRARKELAGKLAEGSEYEMLVRLEQVVRLAGVKEHEVDKAAQALYRNYWRNYKSRCYVKEDVREVLSRLHQHFKLGVVSNFMITGGIEELLESGDIINHFDFVVTSIREGWRKPYFQIYETALERSGAVPESVLFVGDDYLNDCITPPKLGMTSVLLDRHGKFKDVDNSVTDFYELEKYIFQINF